MATSAPEDEGPPLDAEAMGKFEAMFADLLVEVKEGRLSQEEAIQAATRRMEAHRDAIQASPHCSAAARRLLSVETDECVAVLLKDGLSTGGDPARIPDISEATLAALNAVLSGKPSSPEQRAKWPRGLGDVLDADPIVTAKVLRDAKGTKAFCLAFESEEAARVWVWKMNYEVFMGESASMTFVQNMEFDSFRLPDNLEMFTRYFITGDVVDDGEGGLKLKESLDRIGHWEYGHGEGPRQREPLSAWINRTVQRIKGDIVYKTKYQHGGSCCTCAAE